MKRRETLFFSVGVVTAALVTAYRLSVTFGGFSRAFPLTLGVSASEAWITNVCIGWFLVLFLLAWHFWRRSARRQNELESMVVTVSSDVILVVSPERTILACNPVVRDVFGYEPDEVVGRQTDLLYFDRRLPTDMRGISGSLQRFGFHIGTATGRRKDGSTLPLEIVTGKLRNRPGAVIVIQDISERKRLEELREDLIHMVVHDLKSPLAAISMCIDVVGRSGGDRLRDSERDCLQRAASTTFRLSDMVHSLLDVYRLDKGKIRLNLASADVGALASEVADALAYEASDRQVVVRVTQDADPVVCDRDMIRRVVTNLMENALKFTPEGGEIHATVTRDAGAVTVSVKDTGPGIPPEYHRKIFERFGQVEAKAFSTGLGLAFCKLAVEAHGGSIGVESQPGKGSRFYFVLPARPPEAVVVPGPKPASSSSSVVHVAS